ncbi:putative bifunctional diguanylate cyclase/phosphodiesterase [Spiribacter halobius]|nr:bifunctional diguanylate cyclase/phosphodiesterase [Spiribacter halobius]UEX78607.1 bifunctional diguanylate cyclase/phosphodiesterase [Spiribacter halobius]
MLPRLRLIKPPNPLGFALTVSVVYAAVSLAWILLSDDFIAAVARDPQQLTLLSKIKGVLFVLAMTIGLGVLVYRLACRRAQLANALLAVREDGVTGLPNRRVLEEALADRCTQTHGSADEFGLILLDVANLTRVNTGLGRSAGDRFLRAVGERLHGLVEATELVARLEGDIFAVLLRQAPTEGRVRGLADAVAAALATPVEIDGVALGVDAHIGLARAPADGNTPAQLLDAAMHGLQAGKRTGRRNTVTTVSAYGGNAREPLEREGALRKAVRQGALEAWLQPVVSLASGQVTGAEALVRWPRTDGGITPPGEFIPLAEATGLIGDITAFMLERVTDWGARWHRRRHAPITLGVNLSGLDLQGDGVVPLVRRLLAEHRLPGQFLMLEITESRFMQDPHGARDMLEELRALGVRIAIDDFGTGYSSLSYLHRLPLDCLKIDRSFVHQASRVSGRRTLFGAIASLGRGLGLTTVAEGVENLADARLARDLGCDALQGYLVSPPLPAATFAERYLGDTPVAVPAITALGHTPARVAGRHR